MKDDQDYFKWQRRQMEAEKEQRLLRAGMIALWAFIGLVAVVGTVVVLWGLAANVGG